MLRPTPFVLLSLPSLLACAAELDGADATGESATAAVAPASVHLDERSRPPRAPAGEVTLASAGAFDAWPERASDRVLGDDPSLDELFEEPPLGRGELERDERIEAGRELYQQSCASCHQETGAGVPDLFPPLAESDFLLDDKERAIRVVLNGLSGKVVVNGRIYDALMPSLHHLDDEEIANVLTYALSSWGNDGETVTPEDVAEVRQRVRGEWREPPPERADEAEPALEGAP